MGWRFRRSIRLFPGVKLNFSKSGVSTSIGVRGAHITLGHGQTRTTVWLPGSGISYTEVHKDHAAPQAPQEATPEPQGIAVRW